MKNPNVLVLGGSGMLGSMVMDIFSRAGGINVSATVREEQALSRWKTLYPAVKWSVLNAESPLEEITDRVRGSSWVINCIGVIKPYIRNDHAADVERAVQVNSVFPHILSRAAGTTGARVLQIATDCVYSGQKGRYMESDSHDALDVYGKSKSLGEVRSPVIHHLRCSIVGPEPKSFVSLLEWFLRQPVNGTVGGYANHNWNGVTTLGFSRICLGIVRENLSLKHLQHVVPGDTVSKEDLLRLFARAFGREDIGIDRVEAKTVIDRTLSTEDEEGNRILWIAAGYNEPPSISRMVEELGRYNPFWQEQAP